MPIRGRFLGDAARYSTSDGQQINSGLMISLRLIAYRQHFTVGRDAMIVVASHCEPGIDGLRLSACNRQTLNSPLGIEDKCRSVARPIGRFKMSWNGIHDPPVCGGHGDDFEGAIQRGSIGGSCSRDLFQFYVRKDCFFDSTLVVTAYSYAHI